MEPLTPTQQRVLEQLRPPRESRVDVDPELSGHLRHWLEDDLGDVAGTADDPLFVSKHRLTTVLTCEAYHLATDSGFEWTVANARGKVMHKAVELSVHVKGEPSPMDLVDLAIARLEESDGSLAEFLQKLREVELGELRASVVDQVGKFADSFPSLHKRNAWVPATEPQLRAELCADGVVLQGRPDLTLGRPIGNVAGRVIVDLKSGMPRSEHRDDLRFYALLETFRTGIPPMRVASFYLDSGRLDVEDVNLGVLETAVRRTIAGARKLAQLASEPLTATRQGNNACRWCPERETCGEGRRWLQELEDFA